MAGMRSGQMLLFRLDGSTYDVLPVVSPPVDSLASAAPSNTGRAHTRLACCYLSSDSCRNMEGIQPTVERKLSGMV